MAEWSSVCNSIGYTLQRAGHVRVGVYVTSDGTSDNIRSYLNEYAIIGR